jgi:hypothetical protein
MQRQRLKAVTFCINEKPIDTLMWCNKQKRAKRNKPCKKNGVLYNEIIEVFHSLN